MQNGHFHRASQIPPSLGDSFAAEKDRSGNALRSPRALRATSSTSFGLFHPASISWRERNSDPHGSHTTHRWLSHSSSESPRRNCPADPGDSIESARSFGRVKNTNRPDRTIPKTQPRFQIGPFSLQTRSPWPHPDSNQKHGASANRDSETEHRLRCGRESPSIHNRLHCRQTPDSSIRTPPDYQPHHSRTWSHRTYCIAARRCPGRTCASPSHR